MCDDYVHIAIVVIVSKYRSARHALHLEVCTHVTGRVYKRAACIEEHLRGLRVGHRVRHARDVWENVANRYE